MRALVLLVLSTACSDPPKCGIGDAPAVGLVATGTSDPAPHVTLSYGGLGGSPNNDCPAGDAPAGVTALTITNLTAGAELVTLCIGRPDKLSAGLPLGTDADSVQLIDLSGTDGNACTYAIDRAVPITGTAIADGLCNAGADPAGFALTVDGTLSLKRTCSAVVTSIAFSLSGRVAVAGP